MDNGFNAFKSVIINIQVFNGFAHTGDHSHQILDVPHFFDLLNLFQKIIEVELIFGNFLLQFAGFLFVELFLGFFYQGNNVAHTQNTVSHTGRMEQVEGIHLFANPHKLNGLLYHRPDGKGSPATGVAIQFGEHHAVEIEPVVKSFSRIHGILTGHSVHHKKGFSGVYRLFDGRNLVHHLLVHSQTACCVDDNHIFVVFTGVLNGIFGNFNRIFVLLFGVYFHAHLFTQYFQLLNGCRTVHIARHQQRLTTFFGFQVVGQLGRKSGFTRALQPGYENYRRRTFNVNVHLLAAHKLRQFVVYNFHHQLTGLYSRQHILSQCLFLHLIGKLLGNFITDVRLYQGFPNLFYRFGHINFRNPALSF